MEGFPLEAVSLLPGDGTRGRHWQVAVAAARATATAGQDTLCEGGSWWRCGGCCCWPAVSWPCMRALAVWRVLLWLAGGWAGQPVQGWWLVANHDVGEGPPPGPPL